jgi:TRAP-type C4-dicarboxylate transport system permease small subunit
MYTHSQRHIHLHIHVHTYRSRAHKAVKAGVLVLILTFCMLTFCMYADIQHISGEAVELSRPPS